MIPCGLCLPVNLTPVAKLHHEDAYMGILNVTDDTTVTDAIAPEATQWASL